MPDLDMAAPFESSIDPVSLLSADGANELDSKSDDSKQPDANQMQQGMKMLEENPELLAGL